MLKVFSIIQIKETLFSKRFVIRYSELRDSVPPCYYIKLNTTA